MTRLLVAGLIGLLAWLVGVAADWVVVMVAVVWWFLGVQERVG